MDSVDQYSHSNVDDEREIAALNAHCTNLLLHLTVVEIKLQTLHHFLKGCHSFPQTDFRGE